MAGEIARGLEDLKIYPLTGATDTVGTAVDVPGVRTLSWSADSDTDELEGDDTIIAKSLGPKSGEGTLEVGRMNLTALAVMQGGTVSTTGTTPNVVTTLEETGAASGLFFQIKAQAKSLDASGSGYRVTLHKCQAMSPSESLEQSGWNTPSIDLVFQPNNAGKLITREQFETKIAIT